MRLVFFDLETLAANRAVILQIGAVALDDSLSEVESFDVRIRVDGDNPWNENAVSEGEAARRFASFLRNHSTVWVQGKHEKPYLVAQLVAYGAELLDAPVIEEFYRRLGEFLPASRHVYCAMQKALWHWYEHGLNSLPDFRLGTLCQAFGVDLGDKAHDALADSRATAALYRALLAGAAPKRVARPKDSPSRKRSFPGVAVRRRRRTKTRSRAWGR